MIKVLAFSLVLLVLASDAFFIQNRPLEQHVLLRNNGYVNLLSADYEQKLPILLKRAFKKYGGEWSFEELLEEYIRRVLGSNSYLISNDNYNDLNEFKSRILDKVYQEEYGSTEYESYQNAKYDRDDKTKRYRPKHVIFIDDDNTEYKENDDNDDYKPASPYRSPMTASYGDNKKKDRKGYADNYKPISPYKPSKYGDEKDERKGYAEKDDDDDKKYVFVSRKGNYGSDNDDEKESSEEKKYSGNDDDERRSYREKPSKRVQSKYRPGYEDEDEDEDEDRDEQDNYKSEEEDKNAEKDDDDIRIRHKPSPYDDISYGYLKNGLDSVTYDLDRRIKDNFGYPAYAPFYVGSEWINEHVVPFYRALIKYSKDARKIQKYNPDKE